jgi:hypothetical protein
MKKRGKTVMRRGIGLLYVGIGGLLLWIGSLLADSPEIFHAGDAPYHVPHACAGLECLHGYGSGPNGSLHCAKYPPKEVVDARLSPSVKRARLTAGAVCGFVGLGFAVLTPLYGLFQFFCLGTLTKWASWLNLLCWAAPLLALGCWTAACVLKAVYPVTPL